MPIETQPPEPTPSAPPPDFDTAFPEDGLDPVDPKPSPDPAPKPDLDKLDDEPPAPEPKPEPKGGDPKPEPKPDAKPGDPKPDAKPGDPKPEPKPEPDQDYTPPQVATATSLRKWAERMGGRAKKAELELKAAAERLKQLQSRPGGENAEAMAQRIAELEKQLDEGENERRLTRFERSAKYKNEYERPYTDALTKAYRDVKELIVVETDPETGEEKERMATPADFDAVYQAPSAGAAIKMAKQLFGDAGMMVFQQRQNIRELADKAVKAIEEYKTKGKEMEQQEQVKAQAATQAMQRMFEMANQAYAKRNPNRFLPRANDTEGNEALEKGKEFANMVFSGNDGLTPQQIAMRDARAFNWLSAYPRLVKDFSKLQSELAEAKATIEALKGSGPGKPGGGGDQNVGPRSWEEDFDKAVPS